MRRLRKRLENSKAGFALVIVLFLLLLPLLPVLLPIGLVQERLRKRRLLKLAREFVCVTCGARLGEESVRLAQERWAATVAELHAKSPGIRFRMVCDVDAICPSCGCEYTHRDEDNSLVPRTAVGSRSSAE